MKDLELTLGLGDELHQKLLVTESVKKIFRKDMDAGFDDEDISAVSKVI